VTGLSARLGPSGSPSATGPGRFLRLGFRWLLLIGWSAFFLLPIWIMLITGLKPFEDVNLANMWDLPTRIDLSNFGAAFERLAPNLVNSVLLAIPAALISAMIGSVNGYVLSKFRFPGSDIVFTLFLVGMFIPYQAVLIPVVLFVQGIHLSGTIAGLVIVHVIYGIPITTLIFRNYYTALPTEIVESGRVDGAGFFTIYRYLILPLSAPAFAVVLIWQFTQIWNEFLFALVLTRPQTWPVTVALNNMAGTQIVEWNVQMAGALLAALPTLIVYIFLGRYFIRGLMAGALKG
jgi:glucose/mannose transport system permease protein